MIKYVRSLIALLPFEIRRKRPSRIPWSGRYVYQSQHIAFDIHSGQTVLDVGSGHDPFPGATVLGDRFLRTEVHRKKELVRDGRPMAVFDVEAMPFPDKSFDFVYCSHVLEHVPHPELACAELARVGRRGYIETPTLGKDVLFSQTAEMHRWHVVAHEQELHFFECTERQRNGIGSNAWRKAIFAKHHNTFQDLFWDNQDLFNVMFLWDGGFKCHVHRRTDQGAML